MNETLAYLQKKLAIGTLLVKVVFRMALEKRIESRIRKEWEAAGGYVIKNHGSQYTVKGQPDLIGSYEGRFIAIEVKQPSGHPTPVQLRHLKKVALTGALAVIAFDDNVWSAIQAHIDGYMSLANIPSYTLDSDDLIDIAYANKFWSSVDKSYGYIFIVPSIVQTQVSNNSSNVVFVSSVVDVEINDGDVPL